MTVLTVFFVIYFLLIIVLLIGWRKATNLSSGEIQQKEPLLSVIIPVRNEEFTIGNLLEGLAQQEYRNFEIIVVNDDSEDETLWAVSRHQLKNLQIIHNKGKGKKAAITAGVRTARGAIIVTTDADCLVPPQWLKHIRAQFLHPEVMMAFGGVRMRGDDSYFATLQRMEFSSLVGSAAATAAIGAPTMCNGANMAFRKKVFSEVKGYEDNINVPSGDDEFLMRKVHRLHPGSVRFINKREAIVTTASQPDPASFVNQRIRWASKWRHNSSLVTKGLAVAMILFQMAFVVNWFFLFTPSILQALFLITIKIILEAAFLLQVCSFLGVRWKWSAFFSLQILYPFYVIGMGVGSFFRAFEWKHRVFRP
jgi:cellulose synthase/poly-beta-1,6-N-acetylglucosamine synthase-like glycosyltransferase